MVPKAKSSKWKELLCALHFSNTGRQDQKSFPKGRATQNKSMRYLVLEQSTPKTQ